MANPTQVFRRDSTWEKGVMRNLASQLVAHGRILTTESRAKVLRRYVDRLITQAKTNTLASRRRAESFLRPIEVQGQPIGKYLFEKIGPKYQTRNGGYSRIIKAPSRPGDNAKMAYIELI